MSFPVQSRAKTLWIGAAVAASLFALRSGEASRELIPRVHAAQPSPNQPCTSCTVQFTKVGTLELPENLLDISTSALITADSRGYIYVADTRTGFRVAMFSRSGKLIRQLGPTGSGPGEIRAVLEMSADAGDSLHVFDVRRVSTFAPDGKFVRSHVSSGQTFYNVFLPSAQYVGMSLPGRRSKGDSVLRWSASDSKESHVLNDIPTGDFGLSERSPYTGHARVVARANDGGLWTAHSMRFVLQKRTGARGEITSTFAPTNHWLTQNNSALGDKKPVVLSRLIEDERGLVWTAGFIPANGSKAKLMPADRRETGASSPIESLLDMQDDYGSFVEVFNPKTQSTVALVKSDDLHLPIRGCNLYLRPRANAAGEPAFDIETASLVNARR